MTKHDRSKMLVDLRWINPNVPHTGTMEPFECIADALDGTNACYLLVVGMQGSSTTHVFSNLKNWGPQGIDVLDGVVDEHLEELRRDLRESDEGSAA